MAPPPTSSALLARLASCPPEAIAVQDDAGPLDMAALRARAALGAAMLRRVGSRSAGRAVGLLVEPRSDWIASFFAVLSAGDAVVPLSPAAPETELRWMLEDAQADRLILSPELRHQPWPDGIELIAPAELWDGHGEPSGAPASARTHTVTVHPLAPAMLLYTSGTTGKPKGVVLTHDNLEAQSSAIARAWDLGPTDRLLHALPLHHMHGIGISMLPCLLAGASIAMLPKFDAVRVWNALAGVTVFMGVPTMYYRLFAAWDDASSIDRERWTAAARGLRLAVSGSAALPATLAERWRALTGEIPLERFGMTEVGVGLSNSLEPTGRRVGKVGRPLDIVELRLVDEHGSETEHGPGELWLRGPGVFPGYWQRPEATSTAFRDGWFRTGDTAERDEEGLIRILGRTSVDMIKSGGVKLSALEIEEELRQHQAIADVAVLGLPDPEWGEQVVAAITAVAGREAECVEPALRGWAKQRLDPSKVPKHFWLVPTMPRNAVGKVVKPRLAAALLGEPARRKTDSD